MQFVSASRFLNCCHASLNAFQAFLLMTLVNYVIKKKAFRKAFCLRYHHYGNDMLMSFFVLFFCDGFVEDKKCPYVMLNKALIYPPLLVYLPWNSQKSRVVKLFVFSLFFLNFLSFRYTFRLFLVAGCVYLCTRSGVFMFHLVVFLHAIYSTACAPGSFFTSRFTSFTLNYFSNAWKLFIATFLSKA